MTNAARLSAPTAEPHRTTGRRPFVTESLRYPGGEGGAPAAADQPGQSSSLSSRVSANQGALLIRVT